MLRSYKDNSPFKNEDEYGFVEALARVEAEDILDHYNAENIIKDNSRNELIHSCLIDRVDPHHTNGDANPSASINTKTKKYHCFSFGGGDIFWLLEKLEGSVQAGLNSLNGLIKDSSENQEKFMERLRQALVVEQNVLTIPHYSERILKGWVGLIHPYLTDGRGLRHDVLEEYKVGWSESDNRIIMPHYFKGDLVGWQKRSLPYDTLNRWPMTILDETELKAGVKQVQKYKNTPGFPKNETLFNYDKAIKQDSVIVTEGVFRVYKAEGFEGRPFNVVSNFSSKLSKEHASLLSSFKNVYVMFDDDYAGYRGSYWALVRLMKKTNVYWIPPVRGIDLADMDAESVELAMSSALPSPLAMVQIKARLGS